MLYYTGVGSRETPNKVIETMENIGFAMAKSGYILRSGAAPAADTAFEFGHFQHHEDGKNAEIYLPWKNFGDRPNNNPFIVLDDLSEEKVKEAAEIVEQACSHFCYMKTPSKKLHTRNAFQVLGKDLKTPSQFVICWTSKGRIEGGTATAIRIAKDWGIPVVNLGKMP